MLEKVLDDLYRIEVPLPDTPLKSINSYIITASDRNLVVDTGMNRGVCRDALTAGFEELKLDLARTDFFITHMHSDHIGLVEHFAAPDATIYFNKYETEMMRTAQIGVGFGSRMMRFSTQAGFTEEESRDGIGQHPGMRYSAPSPDTFTIMDDGDRVEVGDYSFECIHTPGHSPGHLCLYDAEKNLMLSGDHVLGDITPNISAWDEEEDPLGDFLTSLDRIYEYEVDLALPGHRTRIDDFQGRVDELKDHHQERLDEVMNILDGKPLVALDIASQMTWNLKADSWDAVGIMQKWFATGEAVSHLRYLETKGAVEKEEQNGILLYSGK